MSMVGTHIRQGHNLTSYALFAGLLSAAGLPIYIHAPKFFVDTYGVSLTALGAVLFALRLLDVVQDPLLGRLAARLHHKRESAVALALCVMGAAMIGLFAVQPPVAPLVWFGVMLALVFSGFSFLTICFYAQGVSKAGELGVSGHLRLARWRETGALLGVCAASVAPVLLAQITHSPFAGFALGFACLALWAGLAMRGEWLGAVSGGGDGFGPVLQDPIARRLLLVALLNAAPVAVSATLFLFFVESRLAAPGLEGILLLLFFLSAAGAAPFWGRLAERRGTRPTLLCAMALAIASFGLVLTLGKGDVVAFAAICVVSGACVGADLTLLPAMFAKRMARISPGGAEGFGLWAFVSKLSLAAAAVVLLPLLEASGFQAGSDNSEQTLFVLTLLYAAVPCVLKIVAAGVLATTNLKGN